MRAPALQGTAALLILLMILSAGVAAVAALRHAVHVNENVNAERRAEIKSLRARIDAAYAQSDQALKQLGAVRGDLKLLRSGPAAAKRLESACKAFAPSAPCSVDEEPVSETLSDYRVTVTAEGPLGDAIGRLTSEIRPPIRIASLTLRAGAGPRSGALEMVLTLFAARTPPGALASERDGERVAGGGDDAP